MFCFVREADRPILIFVSVNDNCNVYTLIIAHYLFKLYKKVSNNNQHSTRSKGVYDDHQCSSDMVNHAMLVVGYTPTEWILKNWWGDSWGENGYMRLARNKNRCGVANYAAYVKV